MGITSYYLNVLNTGLIQKYTFDYTDRNRARIETAKKRRRAYAHAA